MIKPISPNEVASHKAACIPDWVIVEVNKLIALKYSNGVATVTQEEILEATRRSEHNKMQFDNTNDFNRMMFDNGYLNIEEIYRAAGWLVEYDKPAYNESYKAYFTFSVK